ncbi:hypothetical protein K474DRAFT_283565 [Panus rudis PR-1116 ss-1]|nr:hypothetical protein K474DRAFT_283565 [Panus rudis PR-1116 ss-1]
MSLFSRHTPSRSHPLTRHVSARRTPFSFLNSRKKVAPAKRASVRHSAHLTHRRAPSSTPADRRRESARIIPPSGTPINVQISSSADTDRKDTTSTMDRSRFVVYSFASPSLVQPASPPQTPRPIAPPKLFLGSPNSKAHLR